MSHQNLFQTHTLPHEAGYCSKMVLSACKSIPFLSVFFILSPDTPFLSHSLIAKYKICKFFKDPCSYHTKSKLSLLVFKALCHLISLYNHSSYSLLCSDQSLSCATHIQFHFSFLLLSLLRMLFFLHLKQHILKGPDDVPLSTKVCTPATSPCPQHCY